MPSDIRFHMFYVFIRHVDIDMVGIWPYDVIKVDFWWRSDRDRVKKGHILKSIFLHKKHMFLTKNFLKIPNMLFVFIYDVQNSQALQIKILTSYFFALYIAIKKDKKGYLLLNAACADSTCSPLTCALFRNFTKSWIFNRFFFFKKSFFTFFLYQTLKFEKKRA